MRIGFIEQESPDRFLLQQAVEAAALIAPIMNLQQE
jgi:hypothetical protein